MTWVPWRPFYNDWNDRYIPSRGLLYSFVVHEIAFFACFSYGIAKLPKNELRTPEQEIHEAELVYLPSVGGGNDAGSQGEKGREGEGAARENAPRKSGIVFKGPQHIKSDPKNPDNHLQTVLQPALVVAPKLNFPMQFPNLIKIAPPKAVEVITAKPNQPKLVAPPTPVLVAKAEQQPIATTLRSEIEHMLSTPPLKAVEKPAVAPLPVVPEKTPAARPTPPVLTADVSMSDQSLAVLNAIQINAKPAVMPPGERLGSFEVSPTGSSTASSGTTLGPGTPGGSSNGSSSSGAAKGSNSGVSSGHGEGTGKSGTGRGATGSGRGTSVTAGNGKGTGKGTAGHGSGLSGRGIGNGSGGTKGGGSGTGNGSGSGAGSGAGAGPFADIEVIGGAGSGFQGSSAPKASLKVTAPKGYDFNIVASGGSGGGLRDYGIFHDEAVYTVYMDVSDVIPGSRSWVLQYADYSTGGRQAEFNLDGPATAQAMLEPPIAIVREVAPAATTPTGGTMTVVTGLINTEGKFQSARVLQCSNEERGKQWVATLEKWRFRSASKAGRPTTVRVILGIPES